MLCVWVPAGKEVLNPNLGSPHSAYTDAEGKFKITTYNLGDGAPVGDYNLCFYWEGTRKVTLLDIPDEPQLDPVATKFNTKYGDPGRSEHQATVEEGQSQNLGTLELTTK